MESKEALYDVILYGIQDGRDQLTVAEAIARAFSMDIAKADQLLGQGEATLIKQAIPHDLAQRMADALTKAGAKANAKPSLGGSMNLALVPKTSKLVCPSCGETLEYSADQDPPPLCPQCGLVFAKYKAANKRKMEIDAVRTRLKRMEALRDDDETRRQELDEEERNRQLLEDQIRKQMGIPAAFNKKWKFWSSAAATLVLGLGSGAAGTFFFLDHQGQLKPSDAMALEQTAAGLENMSGTMGADSLEELAAQGMISPAQQISTEDLLSLSQGILEQVARTDKVGGPGNMAEGVGFGSAPMAGGTAVSNEPSASVSATPGQQDADPARQLATADSEWTHLITQKAIESLATGNAPLATSLARQIPAGEDQLEALARIAAAALHQGQPDVAHSCSSLILNVLSSIPSPALKVEHLTAVMSEFSQPESRATAVKLLGQAQQWTAMIQSPVQGAEAWAQIALAQAEAGLSASARDNLRKAMLHLNDPMSQTQHIRLTAYLGAALYRLGTRDTAISILDKAESSLDAIESSPERDRSRLQLADAWRRAGDLERAVELAQGASDKRQADRFLLGLIEDQATSGNRLGLSAVADSIAAPENKARAHALLGAITESQSPKTQRSLQRALATAKGVNQTRDRQLVQAELARILLHAGYQKNADELFSQLEQELRQAPAGSDRDIGWAALAINRARALEPSVARGYLNQVQDSAVKDFTRQELADMASTLDTLLASTQ